MILLQLVLNGLAMGSVLALIGLGYSLIYRTARVFHVMHGSTFCVSAYFLFYLRTECELQLPVVVLLACVGGGLYGLLTEWLLYRPLRERGVGPVGLIMVSFSGYLLIENLLALLFGNETRSLRSGVSRTVGWAGTVLNEYQVAAILSALVLGVTTIVVLRCTRLGLFLRAVAEDEELSRATGLAARRARYIVFGYGSLLSALAGCLTALDVGIYPQMGLAYLLVAAIAAIVGGVGAFEGGFVGGIFLGLIENLAVWKIASRWQELILFGVLLIFLVWHPRGLLAGSARAEDR